MQRGRPTSSADSIERPDITRRVRVTGRQSGPALWAGIVRGPTDIAQSPLGTCGVPDLHLPLPSWSGLCLATGVGGAGGHFGAASGVANPPSHPS